MITVDFNRLEIKPGFKILDIGCGSGRHTCSVWEHKNVFVLGADLSFDDLKKAGTRLKFHEELNKQNKSRWVLVSADISDTPFKEDYFDLVICSEVLEHIPDHETAIKELIRILKPGRTLAVSIPRYWPEKICWTLSDEYVNSDRGHVRIYKIKNLIALFEKKGLRLIGNHFAHSLHTPYWWLKCFVGVNREDFPLVRLYHDFLTWDMMKKPRITRLIEKLLNPILGKSTVLYFWKPGRKDEYRTLVRP